MKINSVKKINDFLSNLTPKTNIWGAVYLKSKHSKKTYSFFELNKKILAIKDDNRRTAVKRVLQLGISCKKQMGNRNLLSRILFIIRQIFSRIFFEKEMRKKIDEILKEKEISLKPEPKKKERKAVSKEIVDLSIGAEKTTLSFHEEVEEIVCRMVRSFLQPYIAGKITEENDDPNRVPLIETIYQAVDPVSEDEKKVVYDLALNHYVYVACKGLNCFSRFEGTSVNDKSSVTGEEIFLLIPALEKALKIDFPNHGMNEEGLKKLALPILEEVKKDRIKSIQWVQNEMLSLMKKKEQAVLNALSHEKRALLEYKLHALHQNLDFTPNYFRFLICFVDAELEPYIKELRYKKLN